MTESATAVFDRLVTAAPPESADALFDTACVLGGSIAGLLAARVLTDHAHRVVVIDRDPVELRSRPGVPQGHQVHALLPGGLGWMERWFPGLTKEMQHGGAVLADPDHAAAYLDGRQQVRTGDHDLLYASRPFMEARLRERVLDLPGVSVLQGQARGLEYRGGTVTGVRYSSGMDGAGVDAGGVLAADFVVDAMGRGWPPTATTGRRCSGCPARSTTRPRCSGEDGGQRNCRSRDRLPVGGRRTPWTGWPWPSRWR